MQKTVTGLFTSEAAAREAISSLRKQGYTENEINLVQQHKSHYDRGSGSPGMPNSSDPQGLDLDMEEIAEGVTSGAAWGGLAGFALGAEALTIPGYSPLLAVGPFAGTLTGAATGVAGSLFDWGVPEESGYYYEERVKSGDLLAIIKVSESKVQEAASILRKNGAKDVQVHDTR